MLLKSQVPAPPGPGPKEESGIPWFKSSKWYQGACNPAQEPLSCPIFYVPLRGDTAWRLCDGPSALCWPGAQTQSFLLQISVQATPKPRI